MQQQQASSAAHQAAAAPKQEDAGSHGMLVKYQQRSVAPQVQSTYLIDSVIPATSVTFDPAFRENTRTEELYHRITEFTAQAEARMLAGQVDSSSTGLRDTLEQLHGELQALRKAIGNITQAEHEQFDEANSDLHKTAQMLGLVGLAVPVPATQADKPAAAEKPAGAAAPAAADKPAAAPAAADKPADAAAAPAAPADKPADAAAPAAAPAAPADKPADAAAPAAAPAAPADKPSDAAAPAAAPAAPADKPADKKPDL
jgi:hypothetical protein